MAQVVSRRPLTAEARVRDRVIPCGICGGQSGTGTGFSPSSSVFPSQYIIPLSLSRVSSGSRVSDYGLDYRAIGVRSPAGAKDFSSILCAQTGSGAHPASSPMGTGGPFPGGKARPARDADHSPPSSAEVVNE
jgi:hypothetical protein